VNVVNNQGRSLGALIDQMESMRQAFNQNHQAYSLSLAHADGHLSVMRAVINDVFLQSVKVTEEGVIDWKHYYDQYNEYVKQENALKEQEAREAGTLVSAEDADEIVFGGDVKPAGETDDQERASRSGQVLEGSPEPTSADVAG
jgi:hypothetical protein